MKKQINAIGLTCPQPVILTKQMLETMDGDTTLEVLVDNEIAVKNVTKFAKSKGLKAVYIKKSDKEYVVKIGNSIGDVIEMGNTEDFEIQGGSERDIVVAISSNKMGEGDEVLGKILIKGFVYALTQLEKLPKTIIMYNSGAFLSIEGSESLEDLINLQQQGVEILTCGTCLNHYGLAEKLGVGEVTNMYTIAEKMTGATSVIKP